MNKLRWLLPVVLVLTLGMAMPAEANLIGQTYYAGPLKVDVVGLDCQSPGWTSITVEITNESQKKIKHIKLGCLVQNGCCTVDFQKINISLRRELKPYQSTYRTILINKNCSDFNSLEFKVEKVQVSAGWNLTRRSLNFRDYDNRPNAYYNPLLGH